MSRKPGYLKMLSGPKTAWGVFLAYHLFVFYTAVIPGPDIPEVIDSLNDKVLHASEYLFLFGVTVHALKMLPECWLRHRRALAAVIWSFAVGVVTELMQRSIQGRSADFRDWAADVTGVLLGALLWAIWKASRGVDVKRTFYGIL